MSYRTPHIERVVARAFAAAAILALAADAGVAQAHTSTAIDSLRTIQHIQPTSGPIGTVVELETLNLPVQAKVHIGYGATRTGFEALFETEQGMWGDIAAEVTVPPSAPWDRAIVFVAFNAIFSPIGLSEPFHVVNDQGLVRRTGRVTDEGGTCMTFRDQDEYLYTLTGNVAGLSVGDEVSVDGTYSATSSCGDGSSIAVVSVTPIG